MSWYSDGEPFDEHDPPWCKNCTKENPNKERCDRCCEMHIRVAELEKARREE